MKPPSYDSTTRAKNLPELDKMDLMEEENCHYSGVVESLDW